MSHLIIPTLKSENQTKQLKALNRIDPDEYSFATNYKYHNDPHEQELLARSYSDYLDNSNSVIVKGRFVILGVYRGLEFCFEHVKGWLQNSLH